MTSRLYPAGHANKTSPIEHCPEPTCGWVGPLAGLPHCPRCRKHHARDYVHEAECVFPGCTNDAVNYAPAGKKPRYGMHCAAHAVEGPDDRIGERVTGGAMAHIITDTDREAAREFSRPLAAALNPKPPEVTWMDATTAYVASRRSSEAYRVDVAIDGTAVCSCPGFEHHGHCFHADLVQKEVNMTLTREETAIVPIQVSPPKTVLPTSDELSAIKAVAQMALAGAIALPQGVNTPEKAASIMLLGWEMGIPPMTSLQELYIVNGKVSPSAKVMAGLVNKNEPDARLSIVELTDRVCTLRFKRPSRSLDVEYTVTWGDIEKAKLAGGNNATYPKDRLTYHCMKRIFRVFAPDLILNMGPMAAATFSLGDADDSDIIEASGYTLDRSTGEIQDSPVTAQEGAGVAPSDEDAVPPADWTPSPSSPRDVTNSQSGCDHEWQVDLEGRTVCQKCRLVFVE